ncbi:hypothetical protein AKJ16_DCAP10388 [Drosera capensis]
MSKGAISLPRRLADNACIIVSKSCINFFQSRYFANILRSQRTHSSFSLHCSLHRSPQILYPSSASSIITSLDTLVSRSRFCADDEDRCVKIKKDDLMSLTNGWNQKAHVMSGDKSYTHVNRACTEGNPSLLYSKEDGSVNKIRDEETMGLYAHLREQEKEISALQQQFSGAYIDEMQQLNEKYALERKLSDLQMAMDEKQKEYITSVSKELAQRKGDLDDNLRLASSLKDEEDERYFFMTSLLGLLAEYGVWPNVCNASSISTAVKGENESSLSSHHEVEPHIEATNGMRQYTERNNLMDTESLVPIDDGPGIEGFQVVGDAQPGGKLLGCGYPIRGTSLCVFQWVCHLDDGTRHYIEGATNPEYFVTADDVDKYVAVECVPMDDKGRQGMLVRQFANNQNKITCDPDMQSEIDSYLSKGQATFSVLMLVNSTENWEPAALTLRLSGFQVKLKESTQFVEMFTKDLSIKIPSGFSTQFVITISDGSSHPFSTDNDKARCNSLDHEKVSEQGAGKGEKESVGIQSQNRPFFADIMQIDPTERRAYLKRAIWRLTRGGRSIVSTFRWQCFDFPS